MKIRKSNYSVFMHQRCNCNKRFSLKIANPIVLFNYILPHSYKRITYTFILSFNLIVIE